MKQSTSLIALALTAVLTATFSTGAMAQKTITFDQAFADMQADVTKNCGKGHNKKKFLLLTITAAVPHSEGGLHSVMLIDAESEFSARDPDILGFLKPQATAAQMKSLVGKKKCVPA